MIGRIFSQLELSIDKIPSKCVPTEKLKITNPNQKEFYPKVLENKKIETSIRQFLEKSSERSSLEQRGVFESTVARLEVAFDWLMKILDESNGPKGLTTTEIVEHYEGTDFILLRLVLVLHGRMRRWENSTV